MRITSLRARDIRFPTSRERDGSDALNVGDYSAVYVTLETDGTLTGHGLTFTNGHGTEVGEMCPNRVVFKQLLQSGALGFCQVDACCVGGVNEVLAILLLAARFGVPVCPHAGGVGLGEYVQHLAIYDYVALNPSLEGRYCEFVDHLHEHFVHPVRLVNARYQAPLDPGYSIEMKAASLDAHEYPGGRVWRA